MSLKPISAFRRWSRLAAFALLIVCALPQSNTKAQSQLTVRVNVVDQNDKPLANGKVTIKRPSGDPKIAEIVGGVGHVKGTFRNYGDYEIKVEAEGYQQSPPTPHLIPKQLIEDGIKGNKEVTLSEPIRMVKAAAPTPDLAQFRQQLSQQLLLHPELFQTVLQQAEGQPQLQQVLVAHIRENPILLKQLTTEPAPGQWFYWWQLVLWIAFLGAGMLIQHLVEKDIHRVAHVRAVVGRTKTHAAGGRWPDGDEPKDGNSLEIVSIVETLNALTSQVMNLKSQQENLVRSLGHLKPNQAGEVDAFTGTVEIDEDDGSKQERHVSQSSALSPSAREVSTTDDSYDFSSRAQSSYKNLVRDGHASPAPLYLDAEVKSSPKDLMGDKQVFLLEVPNTQGAFVLFADESGKGLVFPNPHLKFSQPALRPVFPDLQASDFNDSKELIAPVPATRCGDRWRVE